MARGCQDEMCAKNGVVKQAPTASCPCCGSENVKVLQARLSPDLSQPEMMCLVNDDGEMTGEKKTRNERGVGVAERHHETSKNIVFIFVWL